MSEAAHLVQFFSADDRLLAAVERFLREGFASDATCVVLATAQHREYFDERLCAVGLSPSALAAEYRYISVDAELMLATFHDDGRLDRERFHASLGLLVRQAAARGEPVHIYSEMVNLLAMQGHRHAALRIEELWNELSRHYNFTLFCAYRLAQFTEDPRGHQLVQAVHSHVLPNDD